MAEKKRVMYVGFKGDQGAAFEIHGLRFEPRKVYSVSDKVFEWARHQRGFTEVAGVSTTEIDFPSFSLKNLNSPSGGSFLGSLM